MDFFVGFCFERAAARRWASMTHLNHKQRGKSKGRESPGPAENCGIFDEQEAFQDHLPGRVQQKTKAK